MKIKTSVAIVGAGPAGLSAAIQLKRYQIPFVLFEKNSIGGLLKNAGNVENYPGFPKGIPGQDLVAQLEEQAEEQGVEILFCPVESIGYRKGNFIIKAGGISYYSFFLIIASGTRPIKIDLLTFDPEIQDRIFYEIHTLRDISNRELGIIGSGDAAFDYALTLSSDNKVFIFLRGIESKCLPLLWERVNNKKNILVKPQRILSKIQIKDHKLESDFIYRGVVETYSLDLIIAAVGREPEIEFLSNEINEKMEFLQ